MMFERPASKSVALIVLVTLISAIVGGGAAAYWWSEECAFLLQERKPHEMAIVFLDVGQGDAIFIQTAKQQNILIDAGEGGRPDFAQAQSVYAGERLIVPFLRCNNINRLDYFITSHPHSDHIGGGPEVISSLEIGELWISGKDHPTSANEALLQEAERWGVKVEAPQEVGGSLLPGTKIELDCGAQLWLLYTNPDAENVNDSSLVVKLRYGETSAMFTGDLEFPGEERLIIHWGEQLDVDILKVGHHGSVRTSTSYPFARIVSPEYSVFTVGAYNTYGHPSPEVIDRLRELGSQIYRTDEEGTIFAFLDGEKIRIENKTELGVHLAAERASGVRPADLSVAIPEREDLPVTDFELKPVPAAERRQARDRLAVDLNNATSGELQTLPGIGESTAENIISYRDRRRRFRRLEDLENVTGIGPATVDRLRGKVKIDGEVLE